MFLPLDYHNVNKHRHKNDKTDFTVRGSFGHLYKSESVDNGKDGSLNDNLNERHSGSSNHSFTRAVSSFKNSSLIKSVNQSKDGFRDCIVFAKKDSERYFDNPQRTLDHSITQKLFDDMGNIAGGSENSIGFFPNQSANFTDSYVKTKAVPYVDKCDINESHLHKNNNKDYDMDYAFGEGTYYKSNRRVAPIYMANPYQPDSMDRAEI